MNIIIARCHRDLRNGKPNPREYPHWDRLKTLFKNDTITEVTGEVELPELEKMLKKADLIITIDSFIQHFCWYLGVPVIVIWGKSDPKIFGHKENTNIIKSRKNLRIFQFDIWDNEECDGTIFPDPIDVYTVATGEVLTNEDGEEIKHNRNTNK